MLRCVNSAHPSRLRGRGEGLTGSRMLVGRASPTYHLTNALRMKKIPMFTGIAITHPEYGIFVGHAMGLCFWSQLESAGQDTVALFKDRDEAKEFVMMFGEDTGLKGYDFHEIETSEEYCATVDELRGAGLEDLLGDLVPARTLN